MLVLLIAPPNPSPLLVFWQKKGRFKCYLSNNFRKFLLLLVVNKLFGRKNNLVLLLSNPGAEIYSYNIVKLYVSHSHVGGICNSIVYLMIAFHFLVTVFIKTPFIQRKANLIRVALS